ncbi:hypothetical protein SteCoe_30172 [Stentor coeruleus]|uniref:RING-type domain-containing protein n=1 Tax=Stentor coeruleus TaxID=5963 RepID=A0A1R2B492_9CILI|nr:hypothetical protein SteCoe_30172 [Stentor coeruleus]
MINHPSLKLFYCHSCKSSSQIDILNLLCPNCNSDFLEEGKLQETNPDENLRISDSDDSPLGSDYNQSDVEDPSVSIERSLSSFLMHFGRENSSEPREGNVQIMSPFDMFGLHAFPGRIRLQDIFHMVQENRRHAPVNDEAINELETVPVDVRLTECDCKICGEYFKMNEKATHLECTHVFHEVCLLPWLKIKNSCPVCRQIIY